jgi:plastocyanin
MKGFSKQRGAGVLATAACVAVGAVALPSTASSDQDATASATKRVTVGDNFFRAKTVRIRKGDTVRWVWTGNFPHNVKGRGIKSNRIKTSGSLRRTFRRKGTFRYVCEVHPEMRGRVIVR